ncbi:MAG: DUF1501 domain-containing protein [Planctomycetes bacterium]|nr:DUF1501 domain-containing protein [Planctomycetota bacterium]
MLTFFRDERQQNGTWTRRECLRAGGFAGLLPFDLARSVVAKPQLPDSSASAIPGFGKAKAVIVIFASGGQSQLETWDPKPEAPREIRGEFGVIRSAVPGTLLSEHLPRVAKLTDRLTIVRSMSHEDLDHGSAVYLTLTGRYHNRRSSNPLPSTTDHPCHSAVLKRVRPGSEFLDAAAHLNAPAIVAPNNIAPGQFGGLLGRRYDALTVGDVTAGPIVIPGLTARGGLTQVRLKRRRSLLQSIDDQRRHFDGNRKIADMEDIYNQAFRMLDDPQARRAFDLSQEPSRLRDRYGRNRSGQACLLARRLVEAGVPLVTVIWNHHNRGQDHEPDNTDLYGWDTHNDIFKSLKDRLLPRFDLSFSALLEDLDQRGLLDSTLVICLGEFGRAPLVALEKRFKGASPGRKHWAAAYSLVMAGAGVGRGKLLGRSDRFAAYPTSESFGPWDVNATLFSALGIDPQQHFSDGLNRRFPISIGKPMTGLYSG